MSSCTAPNLVRQSNLVQRVPALVFQATSLNPVAANPIANLKRLVTSTTLGSCYFDALRNVNRKHADQRPLDDDPRARLESFELAYRMQTAAPEAFDVMKEPEYIRKATVWNERSRRSTPSNV